MGSGRGSGAERSTNASAVIVRPECSRLYKSVGLYEDDDRNVLKTPRTERFS
jgi:hypothetical protein